MRDPTCEPAERAGGPHRYICVVHAAISGAPCIVALVGHSKPAGAAGHASVPPSSFE
jgi:hypothetical protein